MIISIIVLVSTILALILIFLFSAATGVVPMPSTLKERQAVLEALQQYDHIHAITDLGSGWGGMTRFLALRMRNKQFRAVERSPLPYFFSLALTKLGGYGNIKHIWKDFYKEPLLSNEAYITYLSGPAMKKMRRKFESDLPGDGLLISVAFAMPGWTPDKVIRVKSFLPNPVYIYRF